MAFPRAKANLYEYGTHMPMAVRWPQRARGGRVVDDFVGHVDLAPTILEAAGVKAAPGTAGKSILGVLTSGKQGQVEPGRDRVCTARERHSSARVDNLGYPSRALRTADYLYIRNFAPERWPAGDPRGAGGEKFGFYDIDGSPTKTLLVENRDSKAYGRFFQLAMDKRPGEELFDLKKDPAAVINVADKAEYVEVKNLLGSELEKYLKETEDPRVLGKGDVWESYPRYSPIRKFDPEPRP
jgi:uncharacterized sulfatase